MSTTVFAHRTRWVILVVGILFVLLISLLEGCASKAEKVTAHSLTFQGKLSLLQVPQPYVIPSKLVAGLDHTFWFPAIASSHFGTSQPSGAIGHLLPNGSFHLFPLPTLNSYPTHLAIAQDGTLWFTAIQGNGQVVKGIDTPPFFRDERGEIGKMTVDGTFSLFTLPSPSDASPTGITVGPDGTIWFTEIINSGTTSTNSRIGRLTPSRAISEFPVIIPHETSFTTGPLVVGPDGNLWFAVESVGPDESALGKMGRMTPQGTLMIFPLGKFIIPFDLTIGPDHNLWFTANTSIGYMTMNGHLRTFVPPGNQSTQIALGGITVGTDGALWFATLNATVGRIATDGTFTFYPFPADTLFDNGKSSLTLNYQRGITSSSDGTFWLTDVKQIGHII